MNLNELEQILKMEELNIKCKFDEKDKRLYFLGVDGFTVYLQELENKNLFLRVWKAWNKDKPLTKQEQKDMNGCKMVKYTVLKKLHSINNNIAGKDLKIEDLPASPEEINLSPSLNNQKSILDLDV